MRITTKKTKVIRISLTCIERIDRASKCVGKLNFLIFICKEKTLFIRFENLFLTPPPNGEFRHPQARVICPSQNVYDGDKSSEKYSRFREYRGKRFFFEGNFPLNGAKAVEKKSCVVWEQEYVPVARKC